MEQEKKEYKVPVVFGDMVKFTQADMQQFLMECSAGGKFRTVSDERLAGLMCKHDGTQLMKIGIPTRFTVRDWKGRPRYNAIGRVKRGGGKGQARYQRVGKGTEARMPWNTKVVVSGCGPFEHDATLQYLRIDVARLFEAAPGGTALILVDSLTNTLGEPVTMQEIIVSYLDRSGLKTTTADWEPCELVPSERHSGYYEATVRAKPEALCFIGHAHVLVAVSPSKADIGLAV